MDGWIKLYRKLLDDAIWKTFIPEHKVVMITLLLMANYEENEWLWQGKKFKVKPGQFITSLNSIKEKCGKGISIQNIRTALDNLKKCKFLTIKVTNKGRLVNVVNWEVYQDVEISNQQANQQVPNKHLTTNKKDKNNKNNIYIEQLENIWKEYPKKRGKVKAFKKLPSIIKKYGYEQILKAVTRYKEENKDKDFQFIKQGDTFFNNGYIDYLDQNFEEINRKTLNTNKSNEQYIE